MEKYIEYNTKKSAEAVSDFNKDYHKGLSNSFFGKTLEDLRNNIRIEIAKNIDENTILRHQSGLDFNGIHKSYQNCDSYTFKKNVIKKKKPFYLGFVIL